MSRVRLLPAVSVLALAACSDAPAPLAPHDAGMGAAPRASAVAATTDRLAFMSRRDGNPEIYVMQPGGQPMRLTNHSADDLEPEWSPDGTRVTFVSTRHGDAEVYVMNADGTGVTRLTTSRGADLEPAWSPDGQQIAFTSERDGGLEIFVMNADGSGVVQLTNWGVVSHQPAWSPDGQRIAYATSVDGPHELYVMQRDGSGHTNVTDTFGTDEQQPAWSPDGTRLAYTGNQESSFDIWTRSLAGSEPAKRLTTAVGNTDWEPAWSADGSRIAFTSDRGGELAVFTMNADGTGQARLTTALGEERSPAWHGARSTARLPQAITFASTPPATLRAGDTYEVTATGGASGNPVVLSSLTPLTCSVAARAVTLVAPGTCTIAANQAGNAQYEPAPQVTQPVTVVASWAFSQFLAPIDNAPAVNVARAGRALPVKFSLGGDQGLAIFRDGYPRFVSTPCTSGDVQAPVEVETDSPSGLHYDAATGQYTYVWKTAAALAGRCGRLELGLLDGSDHHAVFRFTR